MHDFSAAKKEAEETRNELRTETVRATSPGLEEILYKPFPVLDHGFIRVVDYMGTDASVVQAARVSYGAGTKKVQEDRGLINYLMRHGHSTPFEMCEIKLHVKMPVFVARQWIRHRTASVNEYSARYSILGNEFYIPEIAQLSEQSKTDKQGRCGAKLDKEKAEKISEILEEACRDSYDKYTRLLNDLSLARELARTVLPVSIYTEMYWKTNLHNLMHFLKLRADPHAQYEIRSYAEVILEILKRWTPFTFEAFVNYRQRAVSLSQKCTELLKCKLKGEKISRETSGLSEGEWREFAETFEIGE
ncbi:MAG: FAD-dependent thymidylate synthase [Holosporaceae bacterium]|jgi:thymidylate synthase (FAD)|nr:FAD-dependent thymidylate synthase [Holosporaceae bacterium]